MHEKLESSFTLETANARMVESDPVADQGTNVAMKWAWTEMESAIGPRFRLGFSRHFDQPKA